MTVPAEGDPDESSAPATEIWVDADGCPVKEEVYRVARRYGLNVILVSNMPFQIPREDWISRKIVGGEMDAADIWIADHAVQDDIVITADIPLADRCVKAGARVLSPRGRVFTESSIGDVLATRDLMTGLRESGVITSGSPPFQKSDRSRFLQKLDEVVNAIRRERGEG